MVLLACFLPAIGVTTERSTGTLFVYVKYWSGDAMFWVYAEGRIVETDQSFQIVGGFGVLVGLPAGTYTVEVTYKGETQTKNATVLEGARAHTSLGFEFGEYTPLPGDTTPPIAVIGNTDKTVVQGSKVTFDASNSTDWWVGIVNYEWDFGDGTNGTGVKTSHTYSSPGIYKVTLTVRDKNDNVGTDSITVKVLSYLDVFPWWILGIIAVIGTISGAILFWKRKARAKERAKLKISSSMDKKEGACMR